MNENISEFYSVLSKVQDEINAFCNESTSIYKGVRIDIEVHIDKSLSAWFFLEKKVGGSDIVPVDISKDATLDKAIKEMKNRISRTTKDARIAELQKEIDELKASE